MSAPAIANATLQDVTTLITKGTTPTTLRRPFTDAGIAFLKAETIDSDGLVRREKLAHIDAVTDGLLRRSRLRANDVLFSIAGVIGRTALVSANLLPANTNQAVAILRPDTAKIEPRFLYYTVRSTDFQNHSLGRVVQTAQANVSLGVLSDAPLWVPPLPVQRQIAAVLAAYDALIENDLQRVRILEETACAIYREWFLEFRYPGHTTVRAEPSAAGLPTGWQATKLGDHLDALAAGKRPKGGIVPIDEGVPSIGAENIAGIGRHDFSSEKLVPRAFFDQMKQGIVRERDVALYKDGAHIGRSSYFRDGFPHVECCVNEHVFLLRTRGTCLTQNALYLWLQMPETLSAIRATNANAAQPGINQTAVNNLALVLPDSRTASAFDRLVEPMLAEIVTLAKRRENLRRSRDTLLPRLISGELTIREEAA